MGFFGLRSEYLFQSNEIGTLDEIFLNIHNYTKTSFEFKGRSLREMEYVDEQCHCLSFSYLVKNKIKTYIFCKKYFWKNDSSRLADKNIDFFLGKIDYPAQIFKISSVIHLAKYPYKKENSFGFVFKPWINKEGEETALWSQENLKYLKTESVKLIKKIF
tara:strand:- start:147 stop:626 length:480 start_codon:yes stop_codon:yes gene_type:complete